MYFAQSYKALMQKFKADKYVLKEFVQGKKQNLYQISNSK